MTAPSNARVSAGDLSVPRHHQLIVSLFGLYARQHGGALPVATIITLMQDVGVESAGTRSSISRLKKRGVIESIQVRGRSGYSLAESVLTTFAEGDERIFHPRRATAQDRWLLATFTVPETQRNIRHKIRSSLVRMGFGSVVPGLWIAPEHAKDAALAYFSRHGLNEYFEFFLAEHIGGAQIQKNLDSWWDLDSLDQLYSEFLNENRGRLESWRQRVGSGDSNELEARAFADHLILLTQWRRLPYSDPGLPAELLPDGWNALKAEDLFHDLHTLLAPMAARHAQRVIGAED
ncbi:transcriptional regulator [Arthrobacter sp. MYb211]|uniref:PaaX family transcriptional regulator n=1 Tax=Micrococcaceae TaxID=1268 RepID=UPI000CFE1265|nr:MULTISPECIES: PaaX family transcriptional regulator C-terminal domain-containing protein [unclassified Arthrobacter]PQZ96703.1 transcriptional regulator [Arthrobacter sp. MYb224]PRA01932.1 transcriptional regulator [Arthrobacter sp. MYb229]PRA13108.1 transcriptional regulator [Arthrobacter sp. MYb221]PRB50441.1 transcriptional regulator [Arthrobacter sp. MYb216]PRC10301.1 transcriptional regulator [Arthrobacter sp. MYb211]